MSTNDDSYDNMMEMYRMYTNPDKIIRKNPPIILVEFDEKIQNNKNVILYLMDIEFYKNNTYYAVLSSLMSNLFDQFPDFDFQVCYKFIHSPRDIIKITDLCLDLNNNITKLIINVHGTGLGDGIKTTGDGSLDIDQDMLNQSYFLQRLDKDCFIILMICNAGNPDGECLAKRISEFVPHTTRIVAPNTLISMYSLKFSEGHPYFENDGPLVDSNGNITIPEDLATMVYKGKL